MYNVSLNENGLTFKEIEKKIYKIVCDEACNVLKSVLETLDEKILKERDIKVYRNKVLKKTCLRTIMGMLNIQDVSISLNLKMVKQLLSSF